MRVPTAPGAEHSASCASWRAGEYVCKGRLAAERCNLSSV